MHRLNIKQARLRWLLIFLFPLLAATTHAQVLGGLTRFVDIIELTDHDDQADIVVMFNCALRYQSHQPATEGKELRIQLLPQAECRVAPGSQIAGEIPPLSGGERIIEAARLESDVPGQATLSFRWRKSERFVIVQGVDPRSLRIRLLDRARGKGKIFVGDAIAEETRFALNLDSQPKPFEDEAVKRASDLLHQPAYVATADIDGVKWYRLRVGPILKRSDAEQLLQVALAEYPRAWMAVGDDAMGTAALPADTNNEPLPAVERIGTDTPLSDEERKRLIASARSAVSKRDYSNAITTLTRLQRQPEFAERAQVQELLGLARERAGQLAHAKAEYEEYLRRYPQGEAAERVRLRLRTLREASLKERTGGGEGSNDNSWKFSGGFAQMYRYDGSKQDSTTLVNTDSQSTTSSTSSNNGLITDVDLLARRRGEQIDMTARLSAGYTKDFSPRTGSNTKSDTTRLSLASVEVAARRLGVLARVGRQARNAGGVLGAFDGGFASWNWVPAFGVQVTAGYPVEITSAKIQTKRSFVSTALAWTPPSARWDANVYVTQQKNEGFTDRQAVGTELRYLGSHGSIVALVDYDTYFRSLNALALLGTWQLPARWNLSFDFEQRNSPVLTTRNALIGQPVTTLAELETVFLPEDIKQLAMDRTPVSDQYSLTLTRPIAERFQFSLTAAATKVGSTPDSGGVAELPGTGMNLSYQAQVYGSNVFVTGDFSVLSFNYASTEVGNLMSLGMITRFPIKGAWRMGPRLTLNHRTLNTDNSTENSVVPALSLDYLRGRNQFQGEIGGQLGKLSADQSTQKSTRYYASLAYRLGF